MALEDPRLAELTLDFGFRGKVRGMLLDLRAWGYKDVYIASGRRSHSEQNEKVKAGYSKTRNSYHVRLGSDGGAQAADIVPRSTGWNAERRFFFLLTATAIARGLGVGSMFNLSRKQRKRLLLAIERLRAAGWPAKHPEYQVALGWDGAHVQIKKNW